MVTSIQGVLAVFAVVTVTVYASMSLGYRAMGLAAGRGFHDRVKTASLAIALGTAVTATWTPQLLTWEPGSPVTADLALSAVVLLVYAGIVLVFSSISVYHFAVKNETNAS